MKLPAIVLLATVGTAASFGMFGSKGGPAELRTQTTYFANGQVDTECAVRDGQRDGPCRRFYPDGTKLAEGTYADGKMEGTWTFWSRDGAVDPERSGSYDAGIKVGG